jgi:hypothetical protein
MKLLEISLSCLHFSLMFSLGESQVSLFLQVWLALTRLPLHDTVFLSKYGTIIFLEWLYTEPCWH